MSKKIAPFVVPKNLCVLISEEAQLIDFFFSFFSSILPSSARASSHSSIFFRFHSRAHAHLGLIYKQLACYRNVVVRFK